MRQRAQYLLTDDCLRQHLWRPIDGDDAGRAARHRLTSKSQRALEIRLPRRTTESREKERGTGESNAWTRIPPLWSGMTATGMPSTSHN
jgi:hypothetical protein